MTSTEEPTDLPDTFDEIDVVLEWGVSRESEARSPVFLWSSSVRLAWDPARPGSGSLSENLGRVVAYFVANASNSGSTWEDLDDRRGDLSTIAGAVCHKAGGLSWRIHEKYGVETQPGLLVIDQVILDPLLRGRGVPRIAFSELVFALPGVGLVACYPAPLVAEGFPELEGAARDRGQKRLAKHWRDHGFKRIPGGSGVYVANPRDLRIGLWADADDDGEWGS